MVVNASDLLCGDTAVKNDNSIEDDIKLKNPILRFKKHKKGNQKCERGKEQQYTTNGNHKDRKNRLDNNTGCREYIAKYISYKNDYDVSDFEMIKKIGEGGYGSVSFARHIKSGQVVAIKTVTIPSKFVKDANSVKFVDRVKYIVREKKALQKLDGAAQFVHYFGVFWTDQYSANFVMEALPGPNLSKVLKKRLRLPEDCARFYLGNVLLGLERLHRENIVYKDLKLSNLVVGYDGYLRLVDFGLSQILERGKILSQTKTKAGTLFYLAPECLKSEPYGKKADVWAFGVLMYEMLAGRRPYRAKTSREMLKKISEKLTFPLDMSRAAKSLLLRLLEPNPDKRLCLRDCKKTLFFENVQFDFDLIARKKMAPPKLW